jgi:hypothetical protein
VVIEVTVSPDVPQPRYPVGATTQEITSLVATALQPLNVRLAELHLRILATFLTMGAAHRITETTRLIKAWEQDDNSQN